MTSSSRVGGLVALALVVATSTTGESVASSSPWTTPATFVAGPPTPEDSNQGAPRVGVAADGTAAVAYRRTVGTGRGQRSHLRAAVGDASGRFGRSVVLTRAPFSPPSVAARTGGDRLVAWSTTSGLRAAWFHGGRWHRRVLTTQARSSIDDVQVAADATGGWVLVAKRFVASSVSKVQALDLAADGRRVGAVYELGDGQFGNEARPVFALAVDLAGTATFAYRGNDSSFPGTGVVSYVRVRPHGRGWGEAVTIPGVVDARVTPVAAGGAILAATRFSRRGDIASFGAPVSAVVGSAGTVGALAGPALPSPNRAFTPSAIALGDGRRLLVGNLRAAPSAFSPVAPVAATVISPGGRLGALQTLTAGEASEPVVVPVAGGRGIVLWAGPRGWGAVLASRSGGLRKVSPPPGPPPTRFHFNATNRDVRSSGGIVAIAWERLGRIRVSFHR